MRSTRHSPTSEMEVRTALLQIDAAARHEKLHAAS